MAVHIRMAWEEKFGRYGTPPDADDMGNTILDVFDTEEKAREALAMIAKDEKALRDYLARNKKGAKNNMFNSLLHDVGPDSWDEHDKVIDGLSMYGEVSIRKVLNFEDMFVTVLTKSIG